MTNSAPYTPDQLEQVFHAALRAGDIKGVHAALRVLAGVDPVRAQQLLDALQAGVQVRNALQATR